MKTHKTASTSVEMYFERFCVPEDRFAGTEDVAQTVTEVGVVGARPRQPGDIWFNHMKARKVREQVGPEKWNRYLKFTSVRNPYARVLSNYFWDKRPLTYPESKEAFRTVKRDFTDYVKGSWFRGRAWGNDWDIVAIDDAFQMDRLVRVEHLHQDIEALCHHLGVPWEPTWLVHTKKTGGDSARYTVADYYTLATGRIVRQKFDWVLSRIDYQL